VDAAEAAVLTLLRERGADQIAHPGGTLLAHLQRVAHRLHRGGADEVVRLAALAHAVYGTDGFDTCLLRLDERWLLTQAAGADVERLVHLYGACDRERTWPDLVVSETIHDRWTGEMVLLDSVTLRRFVDLSIVNELDVCDHSAEVMAKYGPALLRRFRTWHTLGSEAVLQDAEATLGQHDPSRTQEAP
jgi:uncharacterized protein DUF6817